MSDTAPEKQELLAATEALRQQLREIERRAARESRVSKHDFTLDSTNGDTEAFFRNVLPEWIHKALQHRHRDWVREEMLTGADFDIRDTGTDQLGVRPNHKEILLFTVHAHVPVDAMRGAPDHKAGEALLRAGPDVIQWLLDAPLVHARYWIVTGPYELRGTEEEIKAEEDSMLRQTEAREDEEELAISPPAVPKAEVRTTLVQTVNIFVDATEAFVAAFRRNVPPPEVALVH